MKNKILEGVDRLWIAEGTRAGTVLKNYFAADVKTGVAILFILFQNGKLGARIIDLIINLVSPEVK